MVAMIVSQRFQIWGGSYLHLYRCVNGGLDSLRKYIATLNEKMGDYTISPAQRAVYKTLRDAAFQMLLLVHCLNLEKHSDISGS